MRLPDLFARPTLSEWRALAEAAFELTRARIAIARGRMPPAPVIAKPSEPPQSIVTVQRAVARADRLFGGESKCLPVALAGRRMLARRGVKSDLRMGTARTITPGADRFHAWLKVGDRFITGRCDERAYAIFETPSGSRPLEAAARECQRFSP